jgi:hypothetical protein
MNRRRKALVLDVLIGAMEKLDPRTGERQNVMAFVRSCFGGEVHRYDFDAAQTALSKLTEEEQHAVIEHLLRN